MKVGCAALDVKRSWPFPPPLSLEANNHVRKCIVNLGSCAQSSSDTPIIWNLSLVADHADEINGGDIVVAYNGGPTLLLVSSSRNPSMRLKKMPSNDCRR